MIDSQGNSKRFGFATFQSNQEAERFIKECDNENITDRGYAIGAARFKNKLQQEIENKKLEEQKKENDDPRTQLLKAFALMMNKDYTQTKQALQNVMFPGQITPPFFNQPMRGGFHGVPRGMPMSRGMNAAVRPPSRPINESNPAPAPKTDAKLPQASAPSAQAKYEEEFKTLIDSSNFKGAAEDLKRESIGELIYSYIEDETNDDQAPKITGMILDLPIEDLISSLRAFKGLQDKIKEGLALLKDES